MRVIYKARQKGKTTDLVKQAAKEGLTIICLDENMKKQIKALAFELNLFIPNPVTISEVRKGYMLGKNIKIAIDNADMLMEYLLKTKIQVVTITKED